MTPLKYITCRQELQKSANNIDLHHNLCRCSSGKRLQEIFQLHTQFIIIIIYLLRFDSTSAEGL